ncbi:MAG: transporter [Pseudomonadota bacterium]
MQSSTFAGVALAIAGCLSVAPAALADHDPGATRADDHAPIGVMGDHRHKTGEWMFSYRFMHMAMDGLSDNGDGLSPEAVATTAANPFFGAPGQPPTLRVVPIQMDMDMHMFGAMYAPTDRVTLMLMAQYVEKEMDHITFAGPAGTTQRGNFTTRASGLGDTRLSALIGLSESERQTTHLTVGISLPTGATDESDQVLAPTGMTPRLRLPYPMQLGSGSYDPILGLTHTQFRESYSFGAQWTSVFRVEDNDEDYRFGDEHQFTGWVARPLTGGLSVSARLSYLLRGDVDGRDRNIQAPVQTADPDRQAARTWNLGVGVNWAGQGDLKGHRVGLELQAPLDQDLDGPQLETEWTATLGYQYAF